MARRNYKRDRRGRFAKANGMKGSNPIGRDTSAKSRRQAALRSKVVRKPLTRKEAAARQRKIKRIGTAVNAAIVAGDAGYTLYALSEPTPTQRRRHANQMSQRVSNANTRGLGQLHVAKRNRRGVYKVTTL